MATTVTFSGWIPRQTIRFQEMNGQRLDSSLPFKLPLRLAQNNMKIKQNGICLKEQADNKPLNHQRLTYARLRRDDLDVPFSSLSASKIIRHFYTCINEKKLKEISHYISDDCCFEDCSFPYPIQGKKEVIKFFNQLTTGMGQNVMFSIEHVCEDDEFTAAVTWHLEWKMAQIPFTRGCSFYECSPEGERLVIKKARVLIESPIKPGGIALALLRNVIALFDTFPKAAEWFLKSPHVILHFFLNIYNRLLAPIIKTFLESYFLTWKLMAHFNSFILRTILYILKKFL